MTTTDARRSGDGHARHAEAVDRLKTLREAQAINRRAQARIEQQLRDRPARKKKGKIKELLGL